MATIGNNFKAEYANTREAFFCDGEIDFFNKLMQNPEERKINNCLKQYKAEKLHREAKKLIERVENGEFNDEQMECVEYCIAQLLGGVQDSHVEKIKERSMER